MTLAVSVGDPAGIGPQVSVRAVAAAGADGPHAFALFGDGERLMALALGEGIAPCRLVSMGARETRSLLQLPPGHVAVVHVVPWRSTVIDARAPTAEGGGAQLRALAAATHSVQAGHASALVTGPTSKEAIALSGQPFRGQTEWLAQQAGLRADEVTMLFLGPRLRVGLVTTHLAIREVPRAITQGTVTRTAVHLAQALCTLARHTRPRVVVAGLNPHAGESGLFGDEEEKVIGLALDAARRKPPYCTGEALLEGVVPAETAMRWAAEGKVDGVVAMMHDQATIASKLLDWGSAVNVTWGLPFLRTSVDHGVAYDAAAAGSADASGMGAALGLAAHLTSPDRAGSPTVADAAPRIAPTEK